MKKISYKAEDYTYRITKNLEPNPNTGNVDYRVHIIEFDVDYFFDKLGDITEHKIFEIIKGLMKTRAHFQKMALPIPLKYSKVFTGKLMLRISPELHRKLYLEAEQASESLNKIIEKKLSAA